MSQEVFFRIANCNTDEKIGGYRFCGLKSLTNITSALFPSLSLTPFGQVTEYILGLLERPRAIEKAHDVRGIPLKGF
jgi:hypothetical protein